jgi:ornithine cyclodeaminase
MSAKPPIVWLTEADVVSLVPLNDAIDALEGMLKSLEVNQAFNVPKALGAFGDGASMHSLGSVATGAGYAGFKNWVFTKNGASALFTLFDASNGCALAVIEAAGLGQLRTSAISGVATRRMATVSADSLALLGTGSQAVTQAIAVALVRKLKRVRVYGRNAEKREAVVRRLVTELGCDVKGTASADEATEGASIVTVVTRAQEPFLSAKSLSKGAHLNAVGAILPSHAEFAQDVFARCGQIVVDDIGAVQKNSREFVTEFGASGDWSRVQTLGAALTQGPKRTSDGDLSLFKAMGMGVSDLAIALLALERSKDRETNHLIAQPARGALRWQLPV